MTIPPMQPPRRPVRVDRSHLNRQPHYHNHGEPERLPPPGHEERIRAHAERVAREERRHPLEGRQDGSSARHTFYRTRQEGVRRAALLALAGRPGGRWSRRALAGALGVTQDYLRKALSGSGWFSRSAKAGAGQRWVWLTPEGVRAAGELTGEGD